MKTFGSLFAGVGGFDAGFHAAGWRCLWQVEWDRAAAGVLAHHWPDVPRFADVTKVTGEDLLEAGGGECPDVVLYGFPCQDISVAGKRAGIKQGTRSGLFYEAVRIIRELGSVRLGIAENVPGLFSANDGEALAGCVRELLDSGARDVGWRVFDSQYFGVAQRRRRVFIVSDFGGECVPEVLAFAEGVSGYPSPRREAGEGVVRGFETGPHGGRFTDLAPTLDVKCNDGPIRNQIGAGVAVPDVAGTLSCNTGPNGHDAGNFASNQGVDSGYVIPAVAGCLQERDSKGTDSDTKPGHLLPVYGIDEEQNIGKNLFGCLKARKEGGGFEGAVAFEPRMVRTTSGQPQEELNHCLRADANGGDGSPCVAFQQNTRDEVRLIGGDGQIAGALAAQAGMKQQNYIQTGKEVQGSMAVRRLTPV